MRPTSNSCTPSRRHFHAKSDKKRLGDASATDRDKRRFCIQPGTRTDATHTSRDRLAIAVVALWVASSRRFATRRCWRRSSAVTSLAAVALDGPAVQLQRAGNLAVDTLQLRQCTPQRLGIFKHAYRFTIVHGRQTPLPDVNANHGAGLFSLRFRHLAHHRHMPPNTVMLHRAFTHRAAKPACLTRANAPDPRQMDPAALRLNRSWPVVRPEGHTPLA